MRTKGQWNKKYSSSISFAVHKFCNWTGRFHVFLASQSWTSETFFLPASAHIDYAMVIVFLAWHCKLGSPSLVIVEWVASLSWGVTTLTQLFLLRTRFLPAGVETLNDHWKKNTKACWKTHVNSLTKSSASTNEVRPATVPFTWRVIWVILRRGEHSSVFELELSYCFDRDRLKPSIKNVTVPNIVAWRA